VSTPVNPPAGAPGIAASYGDIGHLDSARPAGKRLVGHKFMAQE
jgi:hypothetical protein